jgi:hypothetical protein
MMRSIELWCRVTIVGPGDTELIHRDLEGWGAPDLAAVDELARLTLLAGRLGAAVVVTDASPEFTALMGLSGLGVEMQGQAELGKEPLGVQEVEEEAHLRDLPP